MESYIVSARKYRPMTFKSVVGQNVLTQTLQNAIRTNRLSHAYLFSGPRGVGKTTCARILAKAINCLNPSSDAEACNECESCRAFNEQRSMNIHELDAASNNKVEDIHDLITQVYIPPQIGKYSVFIIDEVHMLSSAAFNALLKTLEEPPSYAIFILATTEKHKVLPTIISRCQVYDFSRITVNDIIDHLKYIAREEQVSISDDSLAVIAQKADGGLRDALSIFDQLVAFGQNDITYEKTIEVLNVLDTEYYFRIWDDITNGNIADILLLYDEILRKGFDSQQLLIGLARHLRDIVVAKDERTLPLLETSENIRRRYLEQAQRSVAMEVFDALRIINETEYNYRSAKNQRLTVELMFIRLCSQRQHTQEPAVPLRAAALVSSQPAAVSNQPSAVSGQQSAVSNQQAAGSSQPSAVSSQPAAVSNQQPAASGQQSSVSTQPAAGSNPPSAVSSPQAHQQNLKADAAKAMSFSISDTLNSATPTPKPTSKETTKENDMPAAQPTADKPLEISNVNSVWLSLIGKFAPDTRTASIFMDAKLQIADDDKIQVQLINNMQVNEIKQMQTPLTQELRRQLSNSRLTLQLVVAKEEYSTKAYTSEERYALLTSHNKELAHMSESLGLQLE